MKKKTSFTYKCLCALGFNYSEEEYGQVSLFKVFRKFFSNIIKVFLLKTMDWCLLEPFNPRKLRPLVLRIIGCKVGKNIFIGDHVRIDYSHADHIELEDYVHIAGGCRLLCHQRDLSNYHIGDDYHRIGYKLQTVVLKRGCLIGMESLILPGVTIGEGAIIGAGSLVTKDIPAWTIASGRPAKVVKKIPIRT